MALWKILSQATGVTIAAWLGSLFFMAGYFHLISPVAIVANAVAVPLAFFVLALGLMSLIVSFVSVPLLTVVNCANWACAKLLLLVVAFFARVPGGHVYVEYPRLGTAPLCEITALDVGQGAAIHLRAGRGDWMFDCGHLRDYERTVLPYLRSRGVNRLDGLMLSHGDSSHIGGAVPLLPDFSPSWIADTPFTDRSSSRRDLHMEFAAHNFGRRIFKRGDEVTLSPKVKLRVLYPPAEIMRSSADDKALVCSIEAEGLRVLLMSDAGFFTEQWLLANEPDLRADVLVMGWHDKDFSGTPDFLSKVQPHVVVCTEPPFGAPPEKFTEWASPLEQKGVRVFPQQQCGAVQIELRAAGEISVVPVVR
jgi:beta-lactamase superfamily II metal-dependent hydrolase